MPTTTMAQELADTNSQCLVLSLLEQQKQLKKYQFWIMIVVSISMWVLSLALFYVPSYTEYVESSSSLSHQFTVSFPLACLPLLCSSTP